MCFDSNLQCVSNWVPGEISSQIDRDVLQWADGILLTLQGEDLDAFEMACFIHGPSRPDYGNYRTEANSWLTYLIGTEDPADLWADFTPLIPVYQLPVGTRVYGPHTFRQGTSQNVPASRRPYHPSWLEQTTRITSLRRYSRGRLHPRGRRRCS